VSAVRSAAALLAVALTLAGCGDGDGDDVPRLQGAPTTVTSTTVAPETTTTQAAGPTTTSPGRAPAAAAGGGASTTAGRQPSPPAAARTGPPAPGTYRYDTSGSSTLGVNSVPFPAVTTLMVDSATGTRQRSVRDLRDPSGAGVLTEAVLDYRPEGVHLLSLRVTTRAAGTTDVRELRPAPPVLFLPTAARPGAHSEFDVPVNGGAPAHVVVDVVGEEQVAVGGQSVAALVIRAVTTLPPGPVSGRQELTVWFDRASRLVVKERQTTDAVAGLLTYRSQYDATLQRLAPQ